MSENEEEVSICISCPRSFHRTRFESTFPNGTDHIPDEERAVYAAREILRRMCDECLEEFVGHGPDASLTKFMKGKKGADSSWNGYLM